jgi:MFS family permease
MDEGGLTENELGAVFTCGAWSVQGGRFLVGIARDKYGTRITVCVCLVMVLCGSVLVATSASDNLAGMCFGMLFLGMGSGAQLCVQPVAGLFPEATSTAMASLSGAFQLSGLVFLACSFVAGAGAGRFGAYMGHAGLVALLFVFSLKALPMGVSFEPEERPSERPVAEDENEAAAKDDVDSNKKPPTRTPRHFGTSRGHLLTCDEFIGLVLWFSVMVTPSQYYVLSVGYQLERKGDADGAFSRAFSLLYGFSAPLAPLAGACADTLGVAFAQFLATLLSLVGYAVLFVDAPLSAQYVGMASYSVGRMFLFATFFANIGRRFGYTHYGALVGVGMLASAVLSMLQYPMFQAALESKTNLALMNVVCVVCAAACLPYCAWLGARERNEWRERRREEKTARRRGDENENAA